MRMIQLPNLRELETRGYLTLHRVFDSGELDQFTQGLGASLAEAPEATVRGQSGIVYAARNILSLWPPARDVWRVPPLQELLRSALGPNFGFFARFFLISRQVRPGRSPGTKTSRLPCATIDGRVPSLANRRAKPECLTLKPRANCLKTC